MTVDHTTRVRGVSFIIGAALLLAGITVPAQQMVTETRDPAQTQDEDFAKSVKEWTTQPYFISPLVDHLPKVAGHPDAEGRARLSHRRAGQADLLRRHPEVLPRAGGRDAARARSRRSASPTRIASWSSSGSRRTRTSRTCSRTATTWRRSPIRAGCRRTQIQQLIATTKPHYHLMGGLHSGETGPSEMLMELVYRLATETSPLIKQIRDNVFVSITPVADPDGRDRNVDWFYRDSRAAGGRRPAAARRGGRRAARRRGAARRAPAAGAGGGGGGRGGAARAVLGQVRLPRQQPRHQPVAGVDARDRRLVLHRASADHARPARVAAAALHLQRRGAAESESRSDSLRRAAVLLELRAVADDEVGHAGRLHARASWTAGRRAISARSPTTTTA